MVMIVKKEKCLFTVILIFLTIFIIFNIYSIANWNGNIPFVSFFVQFFVSLILIFMTILFMYLWIKLDFKSIFVKKMIKKEKPTIHNPLALKAWKQSIKDYRADVVFFGDSITYECDFRSYFPKHNICNMGVAGDVIDGLIERTELVRTLCPKKIFILVGINDIIKNKSIDDFKDSYSELLDKLSDKNTDIFVQSIFPVCEPCVAKNEIIDEYNKAIKTIAEKNGCNWLDISSKLKDENGKLQREYTKDGLHLSKEGKEVWVSLLKEKYISAFID